MKFQLSQSVSALKNLIGHPQWWNYYQYTNFKMNNFNFLYEEGLSCCNRPTRIYLIPIPILFFVCFSIYLFTSIYLYIALTMNGNGDMRGASRTSLGSSRGHFASTESLQMAQHQPPNPSIVNSLPPTDENAEVVLNLNWILNSHCFKICVLKKEAFIFSFLNVCHF